MVATTMRECFRKFWSQLFRGIGSFHGRFGSRSFLYERSPKTAQLLAVRSLTFPGRSNPIRHPNVG
jgi:hypothetical protein